MPGELTSQDVDDFTNGRLAASNLQVQAMLQAALIVARRDAGWHVNPVRTDDERIIDGPDSRILYLPTRKLIDLTSVVENGRALIPVADRVSWSVGGSPGFLDEPVRARKRGGGWWTAEYQGIELTMTHGYADDEAMDWRRSILAMVDQIALVTGMPDAGALTTKKVDDVSYSYQPYISLAEETLYSMDSVFCNYRLPVVEFF